MSARKQIEYADPVQSDRPLSPAEWNLRREVTGWVSRRFTATGRPIVAMTLTCKRAMPNGMGGLEWLTPAMLSSELSAYFRRIDWAVYKNASRRGKKCIDRFCCIEGGNRTGKRIHVHALLLAPPNRYMCLVKFMRQLKDQWVRSKWSMDDVNFNLPYSVEATVLYLTKTGLDSIDLKNTEL